MFPPIDLDQDVAELRLLKVYCATRSTSTGYRINSFETEYLAKKDIFAECSQDYQKLVDRFKKLNEKYIHPTKEIMYEDKQQYLPYEVQCLRLRESTLHADQWHSYLL